MTGRCRAGSSTSEPQRADVEGRPCHPSAAEDASHDRWKRWSRVGVFARILLDLAAEGQETETPMIDVEAVVRHWSRNHCRGHLKAHRAASSLRGKKGAVATSGDV